MENFFAALRMTTREKTLAKIDFKPWSGDNFSKNSNQFDYQRNNQTETEVKADPEDGKHGPKKQNTKKLVLSTRRKAAIFAASKGEKYTR